MVGCEWIGVPMWRSSKTQRNLQNKELTYCIVSGRVHSALVSALQHLLRYLVRGYQDSVSSCSVPP
jgi:hypothetical protein